MISPADWVLLAIVGISGLVSLWRGFVKEAISLIAWISAFVITGNFYENLAVKLTYFQDELTKNVLAIIILFVGTLVVIGLCGNILKVLIKKAGLSGTDRLLGIAFGIVRGILICCAILALLQILFKLHILSFVLEEDWWKNSLLIPELQRIVNWFFIYLGTEPTGV